MAKTEIKTSVELMKIDPNNLAEIGTLKTEVLEVVKKNPYLKITDSKTYKEAIERRKALRDVAIKVEKEDGVIATFMIGIRKSIGGLLVGEKGINKLARLPFDKQDSEVKRWEKLLEEAKAEKDKKDKEEREKKIAEINGIVEEINEKIDAMTYETHDVETKSIDKMIKERKGTFGIYDVYFDPHVANFYTSMKTKVESLENENLQAENNRKNRITTHIGEIETAVKNLILGATFETIDDTTAAITEIVTTEFDFQEFESTFETKSDELHKLWENTRENLKGLKELADLKAENIYNKRSEVLLEIGMEKRENGDFFVHDLDYSKATILKDTDEYFNRTVENIKRFISGENAKPNVQLIDEDEEKPTVESISSFDIETNEKIKLDENSTSFSTKSESKPDFVAMAEKEMEVAPAVESMGGQSAFHGATEMLEDANNIDVNLDVPGVANTVGELIELLSIMNPETELVGALQVVVEGGKVTIDYLD